MRPVEGTFSLSIGVEGLDAEPHSNLFSVSNGVEGDLHGELYSNSFSLLSDGVEGDLAGELYSNSLSLSDGVGDLFDVESNSDVCFSSLSDSVSVSLEAILVEEGCNDDPIGE